MTCSANSTGARRPCSRTPTTADTSTGSTGTRGSPTSWRHEGVELPRGSADDPPGHDTVCAIGNLKNDVFLRPPPRPGEPSAYPGTVRLIERLRADGVVTAAVSASRNCAAVLESADVAGLFDVRVDGLDAAELGLADKPEPDLFVEAARRLRVAPRRCGGGRGCRRRR